MTIQGTNRKQVGRRNLYALYAFAATSRLWFDGGLWVIYFQHRGVSLFEIGLLEALLHVVAVLSDVPIGVFADRFGWKISLMCGTVLGVVYTVIALLTANPWLIAIAFAARGLQITFTNGSDSAIAYESAEWVGAADKYRAISGRLFALSLVSVGVAEMAGGVLASYNWSLVYVAFTAANVLSFFVVLWIREPRDTAAASSISEEHPGLSKILRDAFQFARESQAFRTWILFSSVLSGFVATFGFYGQAMLLHAGWTLVAIGILMGLENAIGAVCASASDVLARRLGERQTIWGIGIMASVGLVWFAFGPGLWAGAGYALNTAASNLEEPIVDAGLNRIVPSTQRATLLSANSTAFSMFMVIGFPLFGALASHFGLVQTAQVVSIVAAACILACIGWWSTTKSIEKV